MHPLLSFLILALSVYDSTLFYLVYLKSAPAPLTTPTPVKVLGQKLMQNPAASTPTPGLTKPEKNREIKSDSKRVEGPEESTAPSTSTSRPTSALSPAPTSIVTTAPAPTLTSTTTPTVAPTVTPLPTPSPAPTPTLVLSPTPTINPNSPTSIATIIGQLLTAPGELIDLYGYLSSDLTNTFSLTDWQNSLAGTVLPAESFSLVGNPTINNNWAQQEIRLTTSKGNTQRYLMILKLENGVWKLFGTMELE